MELKQYLFFIDCNDSPLLIVPYGIETHFGFIFLWVTVPFNRTLWNWNIPEITWYGSRRVLLIVPYGIETAACDWKRRQCTLLIVPYGIETSTKKWYWNVLTLLIVPYGIETINSESIMLFQVSFNRTLWNWNKQTKEVSGLNLPF